MKYCELKNSFRLLVSVMVTFSANPAVADVIACTRAHSTGQREALAGKLKNAEQLFASCGAMEDCPRPIRDECVELFREVERNIPTVILTATDETGKDSTNVRVYADEKILPDGLGGRAISFDPGLHRFKFLFTNDEVVKIEVLVREGEKNRVVSVRQPSKKNEDYDAIATEKNTRVSQPISSLPIGFWVTAGVSAASFVSFGVFGLMGYSAQSTLEECSPNCATNRQHDFDVMRRDYLIADISVVVAALTAGTATWLYLSSRHSQSHRLESSKSAKSSWVLVPAYSIGTASILVKASAF
jgi:hypothetical protein